MKTDKNYIVSAIVEYLLNFESFDFTGRCKYFLSQIAKPGGIVSISRGLEQDTGADYSQVRCQESYIEKAEHGGEDEGW